MKEEALMWAYMESYKNDVNYGLSSKNKEDFIKLAAWLGVIARSLSEEGLIYLESLLEYTPLDVQIKNKMKKMVGMILDGDNRLGIAIIMLDHCINENTDTDIGFLIVYGLMNCCFGKWRNEANEELKSFILDDYLDKYYELVSEYDKLRTKNIQMF